MARIAGVDLPREKPVTIGLTAIYGVGHSRAREMLANTGIDPRLRVAQLDDAQIKALRDHIDANYVVEGDLRREEQQNIKRKVEIGSYQGIRHRRGLPVRGQRTHTNARTRKGRKATVGGSGKTKKRKH
jgi:small subunit ribosomal protein S13